MFRLILLLLFVAALALAVGTVMAAVRMAGGTAQRATHEDTMPDTFRRVAYIALIVLMFGVASGWLGAS